MTDVYSAATRAAPRDPITVPGAGTVSVVVGARRRLIIGGLPRTGVRRGASSFARLS